MTKRIITAITTRTDAEWPADHPGRRRARVMANAEIAKLDPGEGVLICAIVGEPRDPPPADDADVVVTCAWCPNQIVHRASAPGEPGGCLLAVLGPAVTDRIPCCVPYCRRTASRAKFPHCSEIICGKHWRLAPAAWRRRRSRLARRYRRRFGDNPPWHYPAGSPDRIDAVRLRRLDNQLWERCKKAAIEAATGLR